MAKLSNDEIALFPLRDIDTVVKLFKIHTEQNNEPNLALLSVIVGHIENSLTCSRQYGDLNDSFEEDLQKFEVDIAGRRTLPSVKYETVVALHQRFLAIVNTHVDLSAFGNPHYATPELVKRVSDVVWCTLCSSYYKDRAHLQSIYSYMTGAKLDSCGTTLAVVAACQALGYSDVHLALSEDHTWVVCGERGEHTVEVTWHGKGNEDKRGIAVTCDVYDKSWLYVNGCPVICDRHMEVAMIVCNMNPGINATTDSEEVMLLQQSLLWILYDQGHLAKYPMAIDNLGDLEEMLPTPGRPEATMIYQEAIASAVLHYDNQHVYPYTYLGGFYYRNKVYKEALKYWARAANVIRNYNYSRDDEEIYKEFLEIANELIPHIMRVVGSGISARSILKDPEAFAFLLSFYDGICAWEEGSPTPVLHVGWAKALVGTMGKFDADIRGQVRIVCVEEEEDTSGAGHSGGKHSPRTPSPSHDQNGNTSASYHLRSPAKTESDLGSLTQSSPCVTLSSAKMKGLRDLVLADRLNSQAMSLHLTAQSQVTVHRKKGERSEADQPTSSGRTNNQPTTSSRPKRLRRD